MKRLSDTASASEQQAALEALEKKTKKRERRGKTLLMVCLILGFLTAGLLLIGSMAVGVFRQSNVTDSTVMNPSIPGMLVSILLTVACYMLLKGFTGARILYSICMGVITIGFLYLLLEDVYKLVHNTPEAALLYLILFCIYLAAAIVMSASTAIKEVLYDREIRSRKDL